MSVGTEQYISVGPTISGRKYFTLIRVLEQIYHVDRHDKTLEITHTVNETHTRLL